jgi:hypothetical protein
VLLVKKTPPESWLATSNITNHKKLVLWKKLSKYVRGQESPAVGVYGL